MFRNIFFLGSLLLLGACQQQSQESHAVTGIAEAALQQQEWQSYGEQITPEGALAAKEVPALLANQDSLLVKLKGNALSSCSKKGCWMMMNIDDEQEMRVSFKDYGFFVPKNLAGEAVVVEGVLKKTITDVETLRHYALDGGASQEEIAKITEPEEGYRFIAKGVLIR